jgi:predicted small lipoprotein YifL
MIRSALAVAGAAVLVSLAACGGSSPAASPQACKAAMRHDFARALSRPNGPPAKRPAACKGLSGAEVRKLAGQVLSGG